MCTHTKTYTCIYIYYIIIYLIYIIYYYIYAFQKCGWICHKYLQYEKKVKQYYLWFQTLWTSCRYQNHNYIFVLPPHQFINVGHIQNAIPQQGEWISVGKWWEIMLVIMQGINSFPLVFLSFFFFSFVISFFLTAGVGNWPDWGNSVPTWSSFQENNESEMAEPTIDSNLIL